MGAQHSSKQAIPAQSTDQLRADDVKASEQTTLTNNSNDAPSVATAPKSKRRRAPTDITTTAGRMRWIEIEQELPFRNVTAISMNLYQPLLYNYYPCPTFYKYNPRTYKFAEWCTIDEPNDDYRSQGAVCYDNRNEVMYLLSADQVIKVDTSANQHRDDTLTFNVAKIESKKEAVCIQGKLHMISAGNHYIFDEEQQKFDLIGYVRDKQLPSNNSPNFSSFFELLYVESQKRLLYISHEAVLTYDVKESTWRKLSSLTDSVSPLSKHFSSFSCSMTSDEKYVLFIGGNARRIYVLRLEEMVFIQSAVAIPDGVDAYFCKSMIIRNPYQEKLCVFGYVRMQYALFAQSENDKDKTMFPLAVKEIISHWYHMDFFYFISTRHGKNFRIQVDAIVNNNND